MHGAMIGQRPTVLAALEADTASLGFGMASEPDTGAFLAVLAASKPGGRLLELGTGTGIGTAWLLSGMDAGARLETVESDAMVSAVAQRHLAGDSRVTFHVGDAVAFMDRAGTQQYDLVYADAWPGKFTHLDAALSLVRAGGVYVVDDLSPRESWPEGHAAHVDELIGTIGRRSDFASVTLKWASGLLLAVRRPPAG